MIRPLLLPLLVAAALGGCASPVPRDDLGDLEHFELLKQMQWMDPARGGGGFDYGPGGRSGYADVVREEIIRRHPEWTPERVALIRAQQVEIGMSHGQVVASIGWPHEYPGLLWAFRPGTGRRYASDPAVIAERGRANRWTYGTGPDNFHVWFREGRVWHMIDNRVTARKKPHIVLVMADDHGWGDTGYNGHPFVQTPTLDAMAAEGFVFDRFYAAAPVCSPTRASVLTGRSPVRTKVPNHGRYMRPHEQTIAETLKEAGYVTGLFGKFHVGSAQPDSPCNPSAMGFDEWCIGLNFFDNDPYLSRNGIVEHREGKGSVLLVDDALEFLKRHKDGGAPMFAVVWFPSPHDPHDEQPDGPALYEGEKDPGYYREITLLDQQLGRLRSELRSMGIADNTLLWYCSDNGGLVESTSGGRARKGSVYEGGLRVPAVLEWPARGLRGRTDTPVCTTDMYPTLLSLVGLPLDAPHPLDGIDVSPFLTGANQRTEPMGFWHRFQGGQATRSDRILKSIHDKQRAGAPAPHAPARIAKDVEEFPQFPEDYATGHAAWTDWPWKLHRIDGDRYELYDLVIDPMERTDLANDPGQRERVDRMKADLHAWMREVVRSVNGEDY